MNQPPQNPNLSILERHIQTILVSLITAAIMWGSIKLTEYQSQLARFEERMISLADKIDGVIVMRSDVEDLKVRMRVLESRQEHGSNR